MEAAFAVLSVEHEVIPPTANLVMPDPRMEIKLAQSLIEMPVDLALSNSLGFGGQNTALAIAPA